MVDTSTAIRYLWVMADLSIAERDLWRSFRRSAEEINAAIERDLIAATGLSGADHGILSRLAEAGTKVVRQQELCDAMRWDRTRMSHHLTRMERRGLVKRSKIDGGGTSVRMTARGDRARKAADPVHAEVVKRCFIAKLTPAQRRAIGSLGLTLSAID